MKFKLNEAYFSVDRFKVGEETLVETYDSNQYFGKILEITEDYIKLDAPATIETKDINKIYTLIEARKKRKDHSMPWGYRFNRDPEKECEIFNKNMTYNTEFDGKISSDTPTNPGDTSSGDAGGDGAGAGAGASAGN